MSVITRQPQHALPFITPPVSFLTVRNYLTNLANLNAGVVWPLDDVANNPFNRVINPAVAIGREICLNGGFDADAAWAKGAGCTISGGLGHINAAGAITAFSQSVGPATVGRPYQVTFTISNYVSGSITLRWSGGTATLRSSNGTFTETLICNNSGLALITAGAAQMDVDNISVKELNIPASTAVPVQLLNTDVWNGLGVGAWTSTSATLTAQIVTLHDGASGTVLRVARNGATAGGASQAAVTIGQVYRIYGWAQGDGTNAPVIRDGAGTALLTLTVSTDWQPFDFLNVATTTSYRLSGNTGTNALFTQWDVTVVALDTGIRQDSPGYDLNMENSGVTAWAVGNSAALTKSATVHSGTQSLKVAYNGTNTPFAAQSVFVVGKRYRITGFFAGDGTFAARITDAAGTTLVSSTVSTSFQSFDIVYISANPVLRLLSLATSAGFALFDDLTIAEISPLVALPVNGVVMGVAETSRLLVSETYDGVNDLTNLYSPQFNSIWNPDEGSMGLFFKMSSAGIWTDGVLHALMYVGVAGGFDVYKLTKNTANNQVGAGMADDATTYNINVTVTGLGTLWHLIMVTWSRSGNFVKLYYDGVLIGTAAGNFNATAWNANLGSTRVLVGAGATTGTQPHSGSLTIPFFIGRPLVADEAAEMAKLGDVV